MASLEPPDHVRHRRVLVGDDDGSGLIFYPLYFHYMSEGEQECFLALGHPAWSHAEHGSFAPIRHAEIDCLRPVAAGDLLTHSLRLTPGRSSSLRIAHEFAASSGEVVARGLVVRVWVDVHTRRPVPMPAWVRERAAAT